MGMNNITVSLVFHMHYEFYNRQLETQTKGNLEFSFMLSILHLAFLLMKNQSTLMGTIQNNFL